MLVGKLRLFSCLFVLSIVRNERAISNHRFVCLLFAACCDRWCGWIGFGWERRGLLEWWSLSPSEREERNKANQANSGGSDRSVRVFALAELMYRRFPFVVLETSGTIFAFHRRRAVSPSLAESPAWECECCMCCVPPLCTHHVRRRRFFVGCVLPDPVSPVLLGSGCVDAWKMLAF